MVNLALVHRRNMVEAVNCFPWKLIINSQLSGGIRAMKVLIKKGQSSNTDFLDAIIYYSYIRRIFSLLEET